MDILTAKIGANMLKKELAASGQVGYVKAHQALILPETEIVFTTYNELPKIGLINMTSGVECITKWDGEEYRCTAMQEGLTAVIGNVNIINNTAPDTGEPFVVVADSDEGCTYVIPSEFGTYTISISEGAETIHTIDPKYLPGVCLPVVELSTIYPADGSIVELTADECSKLYAAAIGSNYVIVRLQYATANFPLGVLFTVCVEGEAYIFVAAFGTELLIISTDGESGQLGG